MTRIVHLAIAFEPDTLVILSASRRTYAALSRDGSYLHVVQPLQVELVAEDGTVLQRVGSLTCSCKGGQFRGACYQVARAEAFEAGQGLPDPAWLAEGFDAPSGAGDGGRPMSKPRLLDLFCGAGGAAMGYHRAGFEVVGVDIKPQPHYPFEFHQADAMGILAAILSPVAADERSVWRWPGRFDVIHASPPCQAYSITKHAYHREHPDLVPATIRALMVSGVPYVIENVVGAPLPDAVTLCGSMFDLTAPDHYIGQPVQLKRHRLFQSSAMILAPGPCRHVKGVRVGGVYGGAWSKNRTLDPTVKRTGGYAPPDDVQRELMGIDWMTRAELNQAIPPAYTEWIGRQLLAAIEAAA
jgi:DNA (cytosine-5)-methyltransferase 1